MMFAFIINLLRRHRATLRWILVAYIAMVVVAFGYSMLAYISNRTQERAAYVPRRSMDLIDVKLAQLESHIYNITKATQIDPEKAESLLEAAKRIEDLAQDRESPLPIIEKVNELSRNTSELTQDVKQLRLALNPIDPEEMFTVLRVGDKLELVLLKVQTLEEEIDKISNELNEKVQTTYENFVAQVDRVVGLMQWALLAFLPSLVSTIAVFIPRKRKRDESVERGEESVTKIDEQPDKED